MLSLSPVITISATLTGVGTGEILFSPEFNVTVDLTGSGSGTLVFSEATEEIALTLTPYIKGDPGDPGGSSESGPQLTWLGGLVQRVDYLSGNYKLLVYNLGRLAYIDYVKGLQTIRSTIVYNIDGTVARVDPVVL
jgi:hypothetical protein